MLVKTFDLFVHFVEVGKLGIEEGWLAEERDELVRTDFLGLDFVELESDIFIEERVSEVEFVVLEQGQQEFLGDAAERAGDLWQAERVEYRLKLFGF